MAPTQTKEEKDRFFAELERLGQSSSDSETESEDEEVKKRVMAASRACQMTPSPQHPVGDYKFIQATTGGSPVKKATRQPMTTPSAHHRVVIDLTSPDLPASRTTTKADPITLPRPKRKLESRQAEKGEPRSRKRAKKDRYEVKMVPEDKRIFKDLLFFFVPNDTVGVVRKLRVQRTQEYGGRWTSTFDHNVTHVIVEKEIPYIEAAKAFPNRHIPENTVLVRDTWFSESIGKKSLRDVEQSRFRLLGTPNLPRAPELPKTPSPRFELSRRRRNESRSPSRSPNDDTPLRRDDLEDIIAQIRDAGSVLLSPEVDGMNSFLSTGSELKVRSSSRKDSTATATIPKENKGFQCMVPHTGESDTNPNSRTIEVLQEMATYYDRTGDKWRTTAYRKAISSLRQQKKLVATREQALAVPHVGTRLADKIEEIVTTNRLRRLEATKDELNADILQLFMGIYDVGLKQASQWIEQGHRTLEDLLKKVDLTSNQRIGIQHYDDFQKRIPRAEVTEHGKIVRKACWVADKNMQVIIGGSFRRGNKDSGDIDLIITKPGADVAQIRAIVHAKVIPALTKMGFLKHALVSSKSGEGSKWLGASCLEDSNIWRRIDLLFVPGDEIGAALIYFTGNDIFNRSMRLLASRKGMRLNQHGLYKDVMRGPGRTKMTDGTLLASKSEERIFEILGVPWREPYERKC